MFAAKYRKDVFTKPMIEDMQLIFAKVCEDFEVKLIEFD
nr:transposase [Thorsellia anophelis]